MTKKKAPMKNGTGVKKVDRIKKDLPPKRLLEREREES